MNQASEGNLFLLNNKILALSPWFYLMRDNNN